MAKCLKSTLVLLSLIFIGAQTANAQQLSLIPRAEFGTYPQTFLDACLNMNQWPSGKAVASSLGSFAGDLDAGDNGSLAACFSNMNSAGLELTIEAAALQPPGTPGGCGLGIDCFNWLYPKLDRFVGLGAPQMNIRMQEPLTDARNVGYSDNDAVNQTVIFMQNLRARYPGIKITSVEAYPYVSGNSLRWWIQTVTGVSQSVGIAPPEAFELDHDIILSGAGSGVFSDIQSIENTAHTYGWQFGVIFCAEHADPTDYNFDTETNDRGVQYRNHNLIPDIYIIESWEHTSPSATIPETSPYTFMWDVMEFLELHHFPGGPSVMGPNTTLYPGQSIYSLNGQYHFTYQGDSNLVIYGPGGPIWATMTFDTPGVVVMQGDGNLVMYNSGGTPIWYTATSGHSGAFFALQNDGHGIVYSGYTGLWSTP